MYLKISNWLGTVFRDFFICPFGSLIPSKPRIWDFLVCFMPILPNMEKATFRIHSNVYSYHKKFLYYLYILELLVVKVAVCQFSTVRLPRDLDMDLFAYMTTLFISFEIVYD